MEMTDSQQISIGISSCLLGDEVRYDGGHKRHSYIEKTLGQYFEFVRFCPEMAIGLGVPREPIRLVRIDNQIRICANKQNPPQQRVLIYCVFLYAQLWVQVFVLTLIQYIEL